MIAKIVVGWLTCTKIRSDPFRAQTVRDLIAIESPTDLPYRQRSVAGYRRSQSQRYLTPSQNANERVIYHKSIFYKTDIVIIFHVFYAISRFISSFIHSDCKRIRFSWWECCDQLFHAQLVAYYYSNAFWQQVYDLRTLFSHTFLLCLFCTVLLKKN